MMAAAVTAASTSSSGGLDATPFAAAYQTFPAPAAANSPPPAAPLPTFSTNDATTATTTTTPYSSSFTSLAKDHTSPTTTSTPPTPSTPITSPPPPLADAHPTNSTSSEAASSSLEKEKVLGVTILTQLQELDLAIKLREQNKVDGRKTRWIEHRKQQEELGKFSPEAGGRKRRSGGKKKECLDAASGVATPPLSSADDASPTKRSPLKNTSAGKPLLSPLPPLSPIDNNNTRPTKLLKSTSDGSTIVKNMKMEVAEPLVGSVEPSNVLETMKQQFLQDTTKVDHLDTARLTNGVSEAEETPSLSQETAVVETSTATTKKKKKGKQAADPSLKIGKKKLGRPAKTQQKQPTRPPPGKLLKKSKENKVGKIISANNQKKSVTAPLPKDISISNFFTKQKTRGLREVRKPDGELSEDGSLLEEEEADEEKKPATAPLLLGTPLSKCPLIAAAAKIVSGKAVSKKAQGKGASKVTSMERKSRPSPLRTIANGIHGQEQSGAGVVDGTQKKKKQANKLVKKASMISSDSGLLLPVLGGKGLHADNLDSASNASDTSDSTTESGKRGRARGCKRKYQTDVSSVSPPPKCTKKTSTVVAEVHNSMNGEPQTVVAVSRSTSVGRRKKQGGSPVKASLAVGNGALPHDAEDSGSLANGSPITITTAAQTAIAQQLVGVGPTSDDVEDGPSEPADTQQSPLATYPPSNKSGGRAIANNGTLSSGDVLVQENAPLLNTTKVASVSNNTRSSAGIESASGHSTPPKAPIVTRSSTTPNTRSAANSEPSSPAPSDPEPSLFTSPTNTSSNLLLTSSLHLSRTNSLPNGNSPRLVGRNLPPSKSSDQVAVPSNNVVPDKPSTFRRKNTSSPVKLIRTASLKSRDLIPSTAQQDSAMECNINGIDSEVSRTEFPKESSGGTENSFSDTTLASSQGTASAAASAAARKPTESLVEVKQNSTTNNKKSPKSATMEETRQSSPRRKNAFVGLPEEADVNTAKAMLDGSVAESDVRTKSPTGSDCDNNNSSGLPIGDKSLIATAKKLLHSELSEKTVIGSITNGEEDKPKADTEKPVGKVPRYLKQLFKDEGVQNMLKSIEEDNLATDSGSAVTADPVAHKLRPKRPPENAMAVSPEPEIEMYFSSGSSKRRRKYNELDTLYMDEGTLNLLTSIENSSRRGTPVQDEPVAANVGGSSADTGDRTAAVGDAQAAKATNNSSSYSCPPESAKGSLGVNGSVVDLTGDSFEESGAGSTATMKRKPGRPQKPKASRFKSSSPAGTPDVELEQENVHSANKKAKLDVTATARKHDDGIVPTVGSLTTKGNSRGAMTECSGAAINGPMTSVGKGSRGALQVAGGRLPTASTATAGHGAGRAAAAASASGGGAPGRPAVVASGGASKQQPPHTSPVRMRRVDLPTSPTMASLDSLVRSLEEGGSGGAAVVPTSSVAFVPHRAPDGLVPPLRGMRGLMALDGAGLRQSQRSSARHNTSATDATSVNYRDIVLRKMNNFVHIIMAPQTTKIKNSLNSRVLRELCAALSSLRNEPSVRLVLITSNGSSWCQGVDLTSLHHPNPDTRNNHAHNLARAIKEFLKMLLQFPKPIIAGVNGNAMGLGVTMLPLFDMVFASDSAEFFLPYSKLGQVPEGGATYTFPTLLGKLQSTRLFMGHKFSASEGVQLGLVSEVLWPANFQETLLPKVALLATQSAQSMEATKALMNHHLLTKLELSVESECHTLLKQWTSPQFEALSRRFLDTHAPLMQKPVVVPL